MTLFAGAFAYSSGSAPNPDNLAFMRAFFDRLDGDAAGGVVHRHNLPNLAVFKWEAGAHTERAWVSRPDGSLATLTGDAVLENQGCRQSRYAQLDQLCVHRLGLDVSAMARSRGVFAVLDYDQATQTLRIGTDLLGIRPVFFTDQDGVFYFSSALHLLESLPRLRRTLSHAGLAEYLAFSFSLADRTHYQEISLLPESSIVSVSALGVQKDKYFNWSTVGVVDDSMPIHVRRLQNSFQDAVRLRLDGAEPDYAFLSGGMDSRAIVASLVAQGRRVEAFNFSPAGSQDQAFAIDYASSLGDRCHLALHPRDRSFSALAASALKKRKAELNAPEADASMGRIWSGDGGSVCLGHVYLDDAMMHLAEAGLWRQAAEMFLAKNKRSIPARIFQPQVTASLQDLLKSGVEAEMRKYQNGDLGRGLYFFLLFNDQRRHLALHFETIHQHKLEFFLPFFDTEFVKAVVRTPAFWGVGHRLYNHWFRSFDPVTTSTPWQTYPGHAPCPLPAKKDYSYQWQGDAGSGDLFARRQASAAMLLAGRTKMLESLVSPGSLNAASLLHLLGIRNYGYIAKISKRLNGLKLTA